MKIKLRLKKLKELSQSAEKGFPSHSEFYDWASSVVPLLTYNESHYENFQESLRILQIPTISTLTTIPHFNNMKSIIKQAIIELEHNLIKPNITSEPTANPNNSQWYQKPIGIIFLTAIASVLGVLIIFLIKRHFDIPL